MDSRLQNPFPGGTLANTKTRIPPDAHHVINPIWSMERGRFFSRVIDVILNSFIFVKSHHIHRCSFLALIEEKERDRPGFESCGALIGAALAIEGELEYPVFNHLVR
jgi:hypothetical protein